MHGLVQTYTQHRLLECPHGGLPVGIPYDTATLPTHKRGYGATAARLTPDQKVGSSNLSGLI